MEKQATDESMTVMRVYKATPNGARGAFAEQDISRITEWIKHMDVGDKVEIAVVTMTKDEFDNLSEYNGP